MSDTPGLVEIEDLLGDAKPVNRQLYAESGQAQGSAAVEYANSKDRLHGAKDPNLAILKETPEHRIMLWMKAQGMSNRLIAEKMNVSEGWVSQIMRQPWARLRVLDMIKENGADAVQTLLKGTTIDSVLTLVDLRDDPKTPPAVRASAASNLIDRVLGKPTQHIENDTTIRHVASEVSALEQQLAGVEQELKRYGN